MSITFESLYTSCIQRRIPCISKQTATLIQELLIQHQPQICIEIGAAVGLSALFIASYIKKRNGHIYSHEVAYGSYTEALRNTSHIHNCTIYPFDITKTAITTYMNQKYDFVFVDGQKGAYLDYMMKIHTGLKDTSIILLDDVIAYQNKLTQLYEYLAKKQIIYTIRETEEGDWCMIIHGKDRLHAHHDI